MWVVPFLLVTRSVCGLLLFLLSPLWWWDADDGSTWLTFTVGNAYVWFAIAVLVWRSADRQFRRAGVDVDHRAVA